MQRKRIGGVRRVEILRCALCDDELVQRKLFGGVRRAEICGVLRAPTHSIEASSIEREAAAQDDEFIKWGLRRNICGGTG